MRHRPTNDIIADLLPPDQRPAPAVEPEQPHRRVLQIPTETDFEDHVAVETALANMGDESALATAILPERKRNAVHQLVQIAWMNNLSIDQAVDALNAIDDAKPEGYEP